MASIYGMDDNDFAQGVSRDALRPPSEYADSGSPTGAMPAKGNRPIDNGTVAAKNVGGGNDSRACVKGNHGEQGCDN